MKTKILALFITIMSIAILPGCKKDNLSNKTYHEQDNAVARLKTWVESETNTAKMRDIRMGTPIWQRTKYYPENQTYVIPIKLGADDMKMQPWVYKFIVVKGSSGNAFTQANYVYIIPDKNSSLDISYKEQNLTPAFFSLEKIPTNFKGTILKYDLNYKMIFSKNIEAGRVATATKKIAVRNVGDYKDIEDLEPNSAILECGQCIHYYLITYDEEDNILDVEYLYSECGICEGGGSGGGGGSGPTCEQLNENFVNQGFAMSGPLRVVNVSNTGTIWTRRYDWKIFQAGTWALISYETGTLEKVQYPNNERWEFQSFIHNHIAEVGFSLGGTRTFLDLGSIIQISSSKTSVMERIDFTVSSRVGCWPLPPVTIPYNANKTFYAPNTIVILPPA